MGETPFVSQLGNGPRNDCGPACALMLARRAGKGEADSVESWAQKIDASDDGTTAAELAWMLRALGLTPVVNQVLEYPYIALVDYAQLPRANRIDQTGKTFAHWIVRLSDTQYHDPYHWQGAQISTKAILDVAVLVGAQKYWRSVVVKLGILEGMMATKMTVDSPDGLNVRAWAGVAPNNKIGWLAHGEEVVIAEEANGWKKIALVNTARGSKVNGWVSEQYLKAANAPVQAPEPTPREITRRDARVLLGVHELTSGKAREAIGRGAKAVMVFNDALEAHRLSVENPSVIVMHRRWFESAISPRDLVSQHGINPDTGVSDSRVWCRGVNENDIAGFDSSPEGILRRARFDLECAAILRDRAPNAVWVAGGFAHGNPDFTNADVCRAMREGYAAAYNAGLIAFDIHNYTKSLPGQPKVYKREDAPWYETRWGFLFTKCGFNPAVRRVVASEAGIEAGAGGFAWAGFSDDEFRAWCMSYLALQRADLVVDGRSYPSPFVASTLYQLGGELKGEWQGYELNRYMAVLEDIWKKES